MKSSIRTEASRWKINNRIPYFYTMKLVDVILISLAAAFLIMGIHQVITVSFGKAYWLIMLSTMLLFIYVYRKKK